MYLTKLYKQSKIWFAIVVLFAAGQLFINYKHGLVFSPFYHYGMFSEVFLPKQQYEVTEIIVGGKLLQAKDFSPNEWDNLMLPVILYRRQQSWNSHLYNTEIKRLLHTKDSSLYINHLSQPEFDKWYRQRVIQIAKLTDTAVTIQYRIVAYKQENLF